MASTTKYVFRGDKLLKQADGLLRLSAQGFVFCSTAFCVCFCVSTIPGNDQSFVVLSEIREPDF